MAIGTSLIISEFSKFTSDLRNYYPPFLSMLLVNIFNVVNLVLISFFFNGTSFDFDPFWGIFSVFTDTHFISFLYMAIVLAFGQMVSVVLVTKMFPDPIIPALAMTMEPFLACFFLDLSGIQGLPGHFCMVGFLLILPGMFLVLVGQKIYQRDKEHQVEED